MEKSTSVVNHNKSLLKDHRSSICARSNGMMIKDSSIDPAYWSWKNNNNNGCCDQDSVGDGGSDLVAAAGLISWPPRSYTCTFCKREFRSAQALGGHMNVHRRDRARLRQMPPASSHQTFSSSNYTTTLLNLNQLHPNPNPNPSNLPPYFSSNLSSTSKMLPSMMSSSPASAQHNSPYLSPSTTHPSHRLCPRSGASLKSQIPSFRVCKFDGFPSDHNKGKIGNRSENIVRLNLEIGLLGDQSESDDLDLELRLGCA